MKCDCSLGWKITGCECEQTGVCVDIIRKRHPVSDHHTVWRPPRGYQIVKSGLEDGQGNKIMLVRPDRKRRTQPTRYKVYT